MKIYATDIDEKVLNKARTAVYTAAELESVPDELRARYFEPANGAYAFHKELRRSIIFGRHDLIQDAPISRLDLLVCRNVLMYFNAEIQSRILARFHFALNQGGFLFLGRAEMLLTHSSTFSPLALKQRIFAKVPQINFRDRLLIIAQTGREDLIDQVAVNQVRIREMAFEVNPLAQIVVDSNGRLALVSEHARKLFSLHARDVGRPFQDLELSYRPVELRASMEEALSQRRIVALKEIRWTAPDGVEHFFHIQVLPLFDNSGPALGAMVVFEDVSAHRELQRQVEQSNQELQTAYEEIQTSNEDLQSTNEELETTNEELQSANEELETMNEELRTLNDELRTLNDELHIRTDELNQLNSFMESIFGSIKAATVVINDKMHVQMWNRQAEQLGGLRDDEAVGKHFFDLEIGLPLEQLRPLVKRCLAGEAKFEENTVQAVNRLGKRIHCHVSCSPLLGGKKEIRGAILLLEQADSSGDGSPPTEG